MKIICEKPEWNVNWITYVLIISVKWRINTLTSHLVHSTDPYPFLETFSWRQSNIKKNLYWNVSYVHWIILISIDQKNASGYKDCFNKIRANAMQQLNRTEEIFNRREGLWMPRAFQMMLRSVSVWMMSAWRTWRKMLHS